MSDNEIGIGPRLIEARDAAGLSQKDVSSELRLDMYIIEALEAEDLETLPEPTYVRGYIRSYAKLLGLNAEELIALYDAQGQNEPEWEFNEPARHEVAQGRKLKPVTGIVLVAIIALLVTWLMTEGNGRDEDIAEAPATEAQDVQPIQDDTLEVIQEDSGVTGQEPLPALEEETEQTAAPDEMAEAMSAEVIEDDETPLPDEIVTAVVNEPVPAATDESLGGFSLASVNAEGKDRVLLSFSNDSWVEIVDANGVQVLRGLFKTGTVRNLVGSAPFSVFLGNTQGVEITINGKAFDATPYTRRDSTSRFTLTVQ